MSLQSKRQRLGDYLEHIADACDTILAYKVYANKLKHASTLEKQLIQDATIRNVEVVGETLRNIERHYPEYLKEHPELPVVIAYGMRNHLVHGYF